MLDKFKALNTQSKIFVGAAVVLGVIAVIAVIVVLATGGYNGI